jgi:DNA-binding CsgD family transcriptional regulator
MLHSPAWSARPPYPDRVTHASDPLPRVAENLAAAASGALIGRLVEGAHLAELLADPHTVVVFVHGTGGIGKSTLVDGVIDRLGVGCVMLDARHVEPTAEGILAGLGASLGRTCTTVIDAGDQLATAGIEVVVVDSYERFAVADGWLRNELLPALPAGTTTILVSRDQPNAAWRTAPGWRHLLGELVVGPLTRADASAVLARHALPPEVASRVLDFARGHPLALELAAEAFRRHPHLDLPGGPPPEVVEELVDVLFDDLDPEVRVVVDAACVLRRIIEPLLAAVLEGGSPLSVDQAWRAVRALPFVRVQPWGLEMNPVVQDVAASSLELRSPGRSRELRRKAAAAALAEVGRAPGWEATADLLHLVQSPVIRHAFAPPPGSQHAVEVARGDDAVDIDSLVIRVDGDDAARVLRRWWAAHPGAFSVLRGPAGEVAAMSVVWPLDAVDAELATFDPVLACILDDAATRPVGRDRRALVVRRALAATTGEQLSPDLAPMLIDLKRTYLAMRPGLERIYATVVDWAGAGTTSRAMGFEPCADPVSVGPVPVQVCALDLGPGSVDGWLARQVEAESAPGAGSTEGAPATFRPVEGIASLSAREREVLVALADGLTNRELAERLFISERTANRHLSNIFTKLGVHNRTAAARVAIEAGLAR